MSGQHYYTEMTYSRWLRIPQLSCKCGSTPGDGRTGDCEYEYEQARARWIARNTAEKAKGCKCGAPATHVTYAGGNMGGVPVEFWTCEEHQNVNVWSKVGDGPYVPVSEYTDADREWIR